MLPLGRQDRYRALYRALEPAWQPSTAQYEARVQRYIDTHGPAIRVLDAGCGAGGVLERHGHRVAVAVGLDGDRASLRRHRAPAVQLTQGLLDQLPFATASFDLVISAWVLEHLAQPAPVFREIARVLKPEGHFIVITPNARSLLTRLNRVVPQWAQARLVRQLYGRAGQDTFPVQYRANTVEQVVRLAARVGLAPVALDTVSDPTYLAFTDAVFALSVLVEAAIPPRYAVHLVGEFVKRT